MMHARALVFDVDDTLYDLAAPYREAYAKTFGTRHNLPVDELFKMSRVYSDKALDLLTEGKISEEDHKVLRVQWTLQDWGVAVSREEALNFQKVYAEAQQHVSLYPEAIEMLDACILVGIPMGLITNGDGPHQREKARLLGLDRWFPLEHCVFSGDWGVHKPSLVLYHAIEDALGVAGLDVWYVGDTYETDIIGAKRAGWSCIWVDVRGRQKPAVAEQPNVTVHSPLEMKEAVIGLLRA